MPSLPSSSAMVVVVRRDQRKPVMGSPAVSCWSRQWRTAIIAFGKLGRGGTNDELEKPLIAVQRVQIPPDQS